MTAMNPAGASKFPAAAAGAEDFGPIGLDSYPPDGGDWDQAAASMTGGDVSRMPPQDIVAEQSVLGSMLLSKDAIADVHELLTGPEFYRPAHEVVFDAITDLYARGEPADPVTVAAELQRSGELARIGGAAYLHTLAANVPIAANATYYADIVREKALLRRLVAAGTRIVQMGYSGQGAVDDTVDRAQAEIFAITEKRSQEDYASLSDIMEATLDEIEAIENNDGRLRGVPTGLHDLDALTNGLKEGQMIIVAGRPGSGKSTLGLDFCRAASIHNNLTSVIFSLEMSKTEITMRMLAAEAQVTLDSILHGKMTQDDWDRMASRMGEISSAPLFIDDSPNMTMMEIRAKARRLKQRHDLQLIVIDYLQLMSSGKQVESRQVEVSEFSRQIKLLAKELEVPIVALSQLNRSSQQRSDKRPVISDLRESGSLEQDADIVMLVHREDMYEPESPRRGEADIIIGKNRNGPVRDVVASFQGHYSRFTDMPKSDFGSDFGSDFAPPPPPGPAPL